MQLELHRGSFDKVDVIWNLPRHLILFHYEITLFDATDSIVTNVHEGYNNDCFNFSNLVAGHSYEVCVTVSPLSCEMGYNNRFCARACFRADFTYSDLLTLMKLASIHLKGSYRKCSYFYRDKTCQYFADITRNSGVMEAYVKDENGDPASVINGNLNGLFFGVNVDVHGEPSTPSVFGPQRLTIPVEYFLGNSNYPRLYFADFYCLTKNKSHLVTLVMAQPGGEADCFCQARLVELDWRDNRFLYVSEDGYNLMVSSDVRVEVLCVEDIDLNDVCFLGGSLQRVAFTGTIRHGGKYKRADCTVCNI